MQFPYEPFILKRMAEGRIFQASPKMPFESFLNIFQTERPYFVVSQLEDGRVAITPNASCVPQNFFLQGPHEFLPDGYEYVTIKDATYPLIITAHPVPLDEWLVKFDRWVKPWVNQTLAEFINTSRGLTPVKEYGRLDAMRQGFARQPERQQQMQPQYAETLTK
jgi:hypothetical protein